MKLTLRIVAILVGALFIFSGLVKADDPMGLSYKMKEFFEIWNSDLQHSALFFRSPIISTFRFLHEHSLGLSVVMIAFEIIAGVALLLGWRMKLFGWLLLALILFFTFLTGYAFYSGRFTNCGCFGDCIPITPRTSFLKDLALTILIVFLFSNRQRIHPALRPAANGAIMAVTAILSFALQWYVLNYLPPVDCLPFKRGNNIAEEMKPPPGSLPDSFAIRFVYEKGGRRFEFSPADLPGDLNTYTFVDRKDKLVRKGNADPPIKGFSLRGVSGVDSTESVLSEPACLLLFSETFAKSTGVWQRDFQRLANKAKEKNVPVYIVTASLDEATERLERTPFAAIPLFECDFTAIRTAARTNPCLYLLNHGTVINKWSYRTMSAATKYLQ